jgi:SAM-dependent methyltransferase
VSCSQCRGIETEFNRRLAERELRRFRRRGPTKSTRMLLADLEPVVTPDSTLLDIGGGVGAIHHEMLDAGAVSAVHVDASSAYIDAARDEATRRHHLEGVEFVQGDFVELAPTIVSADIVTLDRVICCYPNMPALVGRAADKTRVVLGAVYPPDVWWIRIAVRCINYFMRLRESPFRVFVHSAEAIEAELKKHGLERATQQRTIAWVAATFRRTGGRVDG